MYAVPESPDIIESIPEFMSLSYWDKIQEHRLRALKAKCNAKESKMTSEELVSECKKVVNEGRLQNKHRSIVGLFSCLDDLVMERLVGTAVVKSMLSNEARDAFTL